MSYCDLKIFSKMLDWNTKDHILEKGNKMNRCISRAQVKIWLVLGSLIAIGVCGILWHGLIPLAWVDVLVKELSSALIVAGVLGVTVDTFLKKELARDVFTTAFNYVLPKELKDEVRRIIEYKFLCIESNTIIKLTPIQNDLMRVNMSHERLFENISDHGAQFMATFALDEWGFDSHSAIEECRLIFSDGREEPLEDDLDYKDRRDALGRKTKEVTVDSGAKVRVVTKGFEIHRRNSEVHISFSHPSVKPSVVIELPEDQCDHLCSFVSIPDRRITKSEINLRYQLDGNQFPGQHIRVRWWPITAAAGERPAAVAS